MPANNFAAMSFILLSSLSGSLAIALKNCRGVSSTSCSTVRKTGAGPGRLILNQNVLRRNNCSPFTRVIENQRNFPVPKTNIRGLKPTFVILPTANFGGRRFSSTLRIFAPARRSTARILDSRMQLPPFTWKSGLLFMVGVIAALLGAYFLFATLYNSTPKVRVPPPPPASSQLHLPYRGHGRSTGELPALPIPA